MTTLSRYPKPTRAEETTVLDKLHKMTEQQHIIAAALLGVSNAGQDLLFRGPSAQFKPDHIGRMMRRSVSLESAVLYFVQEICENDDMLDMFTSEARSWFKKLRGRSLEYCRRTWPYYAEHFDAMEVRS